MFDGEEGEEGEERRKKKREEGRVKETKFLEWNFS